MTEYQLLQIRKKQLIDSISEMLKKGGNAIIPTILISGILVLIYLLLVRKKSVSTRKKSGVVLMLVYTTFLMEMTIFLRETTNCYRIKLVPFMTPGGTHLLLLYALANMIVFVPIGIALKMIRPEIKSYRKVVRFSAIISGAIEVTQFLLKCGVCQTEDFLMNVLGAIIGWWLCGKILSKRK